MSFLTLLTYSLLFLPINTYIPPCYYFIVEVEPAKARLAQAYNDLTVNILLFL
nr:MAG TPA: hypothetical protein [Caudoviricetes sp.]